MNEFPLNNQLDISQDAPLCPEMELEQGQDVVHEHAQPEQEAPEELSQEGQEADKDGYKLRLAEITIQRTGLYDDVKNIWNSIGLLRNADDVFPASQLMPILLKQDLPHYTEYVSATRKEPILSYILENSNQKKVREFDGLVDQANILRADALVDAQSGGTQADFYAEKLLDLCDQAMILIKGDDENAYEAKDSVLDGTEK